MIVFFDLLHNIFDIALLVKMHKNVATCNTDTHKHQLLVSGIHNYEEPHPVNYSNIFADVFEYIFLPSSQNLWGRKSLSCTISCKNWLYMIRTSYLNLLNAFRLILSCQKVYQNWEKHKQCRKINSFETLQYMCHCYMQTSIVSVWHSSKEPHQLNWLCIFTPFSIRFIKPLTASTAK